MFALIARRFHAWKRYRAAIDELSHLNDRELADIGISRSDIPRLVCEYVHDCRRGELNAAAIARSQATTPSRFGVASLECLCTQLPGSRA